jgi:hypothetical protein
MNKKEVQQRVLQNGKPLDLDKFSWHETTKTFSTIERNLVLDFDGIDFCTFITGWGSTFRTGSDCNFRTGYRCNFITGRGCTFRNCSDCNFITGSDCNFITGSGCTFKTGINCVCIRKDVFEFFEIPVDIKIKLNNCGVKGFKVLEAKKLIKFKIERIVECETEEEARKLLKDGENMVLID